MAQVGDENGQAQLAGSSRGYEVGDLLIDTRIRSVSRDGRALDLPRLSYALLLALVEAAPNLLDQDELIARVWPGRVVSPETVTQRVRLLRRALGDDAQDPRYIGLSRGQGYRLLPEVRVVELQGGNASHASSAAWKTRMAGLDWRWPLVSLVVAVPVLLYVVARLDSDPPASTPPIAANAVAVLPLRNLTGDPAIDYIGEGLGAELRNQLASVSSLQVAGSLSSAVVFGNNQDVREAARRLGVRYLVSGDIRAADEGLGITVRLIDGESGFLLWSERFQGVPDRLLDLQQDIARGLVVELLPEAQPPLEPATDSDSAHENLMLARYFEEQLRDRQVIDEELQARVIELYQSATEADPDSALAQARLAGALLFRGDVAAAAAPIQRALAINPDLSDVQYILGLYHYRRGDAAAGEAYQRAIDRNPSHADATTALGMWTWHQSDFERTEDLFERAVELDPLSLARYSDLGNYYAMAGLKAKAHTLAQEVLNRFPDSEGYSVAARIYERVGDIDVGIALATRALQMDPDARERSWQIAELYARIGDFDAAQRFESQFEPSQLFWARRYDELIEVGSDRLIDDPGDLKLYYMVAFALNAEGYHTGAVRLLRQAGLPERVLASSRRNDGIQALATMYRDDEVAFQIGSIAISIAR
ncbi:MAG: winged helix-turn-helix domain-containing protein [Gammaproteobacteria bacterium]|nr:winged helix-turn-helix domain-containing protein [Gammaproteobacteria bacterium]